MDALLLNNYRIYLARTTHVWYIVLEKPGLEGDLLPLKWAPRGCPLPLKWEIDDVREKKTGYPIRNNKFCNMSSAITKENGG